MVFVRRDRPTDYVLIHRTQDFFLMSLKGKVTDPKLRAAWREFHRFYDPIIRRCAVSCGIQGRELEDVMQTAWALVIKDLRSFKCDPSQGKFRDWLFARVRNLSVNQVRDAERCREHCAGVHFTGHETGDFEPAQVFEQQWDELVLYEALRELQRYVSDFDYKLFVMRRFHQMSVAELVEDTGVCEATIRSKLHRTLATLRELIEIKGYRDLMFQYD